MYAFGFNEPLSKQAEQIKFGKRRGVGVRAWLIRFSAKITDAPNLPILNGVKLMKF